MSKPLTPRRFGLVKPFEALAALVAIRRIW
jgi:hypothetical protein